MVAKSWLNTSMTLASVALTVQWVGEIPNRCVEVRWRLDESRMLPCGFNESIETRLRALWLFDSGKPLFWPVCLLCQSNWDKPCWRCTYIGRVRGRQHATQQPQSTRRIPESKPLFVYFRSQRTLPRRPRGSGLNPHALLSAGRPLQKPAHSTATRLHQRPGLGGFWPCASCVSQTGTSPVGGAPTLEE